MAMEVRHEAERLTQELGDNALRQARTHLESATAARDHKAGIYWADVCSLLSAPNASGKQSEF